MLHLNKSCTEVHMESGPIGKTLLVFSAPILLSQILQQFYSIADCMIVGHFGGNYGLAAAGVAGLVLSVIINFFIGFSVGISAVTSKLFGSYRYKTLKKTISTVIYLSMILGALLTAVGWWNAGTFLRWLNCPEETFLSAKVYLRICIFGMIPQLIYNVGNAVLRSLGNTRSSLLFLTMSSVLNVILDFLLVVGAGAGLEGAAFATLISQWMLACVMLWKLMNIDENYRLSFTERPLSLQELGRIFQLGIPSGMQAVFMSISSLVIQVSINQFGSDAVAGMTVFAKVEGFLYYPTFSYGMALTGFIGQNLGAGRLDRIQEAMKKSLQISVAVILPLSFFLIFCSKYILLCFTRDPGIIANGEEAIRYVFPFYFLYAINQVYIGGMKGLGKTGYPMICSMVCYCLFRIGWCQLLFPFWWDMRVVYTAYDVSWMIMIVLLAVRYYQSFRELQCKVAVCE